MIAILNGGLELAYDDGGTGMPLLFIHGWPHNRSLWSAQVSGLQAHARCIAPDLRGFGDSNRGESATIDQYGDDLAALLTFLGVERAVLCGLSMGGYVALSMVRRHRALIRGLILTSTRATADTPEGKEKRARLIQFVEERGVDALASKQLRTMVGETTYASRPDILESLRTLMAGARKDSVIAALRAMAGRTDATGLLAGIDFPTLVVSGNEDSFTVPDEMRSLAAAIPRCRFETIESAGHVCPFERPAAFNHVAAEFLASLTCD